MPHDHSGRIARQTLRRFCRNVCAVLEDGLAGRVRICEHGRIDVDHHLIALSRCSWLDSVVKYYFSDQGEGIGLLLTPCGWIVGNEQARSGRNRTVRSRGNVCGASLLVERVAPCLERLNQYGSGLRLQPAVDDHHPVFVLIDVKTATAVTLGRLPRFGDPIDPPPPADDPLNVLRGARPADGEQPLFGLGRGDSGERADFRVR